MRRLLIKWLRLLNTGTKVVTGCPRMILDTTIEYDWLSVSFELYKAPTCRDSGNNFGHFSVPFLGYLCIIVGYQPEKI